MVDLWLEYNWKGGAVFLRAENKYAFGLGVGLLESGFLTDYGPQITVGWLMKF